MSTKTSVRALVEASMSLGQSASDARLAVGLERPPRASGLERINNDVGLSVAQVEQFRRDRFVRVPKAFEDSTAMEALVWQFLERRGIDRTDPTSWPTGDARHLQKLLRDPVFMAIGGHRTSTAIDDLLGRGRWNRPHHWGELLVTFPEPGRPWTVPTLWHTDSKYDDPVDRPRGVMVLSFLNRVPHRHGGTLMIAGSHRLIARFVADRPPAAEERSAVTRRHFYRSHPWLTELVETDAAKDRYEQFRREVEIDGIPARLVELAGEPGDIVIAHPLIAHSVSPNGGSQPRFMRITRPSAVATCPLA